MTPSEKKTLFIHVSQDIIFTHVSRSQGQSYLLEQNPVLAISSKAVRIRTRESVNTREPKVN